MAKVNSVNGNATLSFCVNLNRSRVFPSDFSTRYSEPASAEVISRALRRIISKSCSTSRVSESATPIRFNSSSSWLARDALRPCRLAAFARAGFRFDLGLIFVNFGFRPHAPAAAQLPQGQQYSQSTVHVLNP